jgi:hypothetical protein
LVLSSKVFKFLQYLIKWFCFKVHRYVGFERVKFLRELIEHQYCLDLIVKSKF